MNLQQLRSFVTVVDAGSFTAAARRLHVAQPSLSQSIRGLEAELGGELLERLPRALRLTAAGEAFLPNARAAVQAADDAAGLARRAIAIGPGNLCLAVGPSVPAPLVAAALARWAGGGDPERRVRWHDHPTQERVEEKARSGVGTVGLGLRPPAWEGPVVEVAREELVVAVAATDPLAAAGGPVALGTLAGRRWIGVDRDRAERDAVGAAFAAAGFLPREPYETSGPDAALRLVRAGIGVAIVPRTTAAAAPGVALVALEDPPALALCAFTDRPWTAPALDFLTALVTTSERAEHDVQPDEAVLGVPEPLGDRREDLEPE